jgi:hypothetical protein
MCREENARREALALQRIQSWQTGTNFLRHWAYVHGYLSRWNLRPALPPDGVAHPEVGGGGGEGEEG